LKYEYDVISSYRKLIPPLRTHAYTQELEKLADLARTRTLDPAEQSTVERLIMGVARDSGHGHRSFDVLARGYELVVDFAALGSQAALDVNVHRRMLNVLTWCVILAVVFEGG
jgi:hypothetical protein